MTDAYDGKTGSDYDELLDRLATTCTDDDGETVAALSRYPDLRVTARLTGWIEDRGSRIEDRVCSPDDADE